MVVYKLMLNVFFIVDFFSGVVRVFNNLDREKVERYLFLLRIFFFYIDYLLCMILLRIKNV